MDKFDIHEWKLTQLLSEGEGADLAFDMIKLVREKGNAIKDPQERDIFFERVSEAFTGYMEEGLSESEELNEKENPCWDGYEMVGMKDKDGKSVPNCVPIKE